MNPFTPEEDAEEIWGEAYLQGRTKYEAGSKEHKTAFWSAGASWYAEELRGEAIDSIAYLYHLRTRLESIRSLARMMREDEDMTLSMAATILEHLAGNHPPKTLPKPHNHD